jgi:hypothetical protein
MVVFKINLFIIKVIENNLENIWYTKQRYVKLAIIILLWSYICTAADCRAVVRGRPIFCHQQ